jgi:hypothetical protein
MYSYKDIEQVREWAKLQIMYRELFIIVALVVGYVVGLLY